MESKTHRITAAGVVARIGYVPALGDAPAYYAVWLAGKNEVLRLIPQSQEEHETFALTTLGDKLQYTIELLEDSFVPISPQKLVSFDNRTLTDPMKEFARREPPISMKKNF